MVDKSAAWHQINELVNRFGDQYYSYMLAGYNETLTRRDFIDPFFKSLGPFDLVYYYILVLKVWKR